MKGAIEIVCTGQGTHPRRRLGFVLEVMDRSPAGVGCEMMRDGAGAGTGYRIRCGEPRCRKDTEFTLDRWAVLVAGLDAVRAGRLDVSRLPF